MILSRTYARSLIRNGSAIPAGSCTDSDGNRWQILNRPSLDRVDHYRLNIGEDARGNDYPDEIPS